MRAVCLICKEPSKGSSNYPNTEAKNYVCSRCRPKEISDEEAMRIIKEEFEKE